MSQNGSDGTDIGVEAPRKRRQAAALKRFARRAVIFTTEGLTTKARRRQEGNGSKGTNGTDIVARVLQDQRKAEISYFRSQISKAISIEIGLVD